MPRKQNRRLRCPECLNGVLIPTINGMKCKTCGKIQDFDQIREKGGMVIIEDLTGTEEDQTIKQAPK